MNISPLQKLRNSYVPVLPAVLQNSIDSISIGLKEDRESIKEHANLKELFPKLCGKPLVNIGPGSNVSARRNRRVGVVLSGGQAPGGHNVIAGILDSMKEANSESELLGFLQGPAGILENKAMELTPRFLDSYRNTGGFDMIGSGRTKIDGEENLRRSLEVVQQRKLDALVVIGGDDSNTNAALMAEYFLNKEQNTMVIGVPKTIDGDLKNECIEVSFGFDTATKTYSELIGNICRDADSARKYWHFIKLMGRSASHIALECALQTCPNICLISEEVAYKKTTLNQIVEKIVEVVCARSKNGEDFGVVLVPEGVIEFIPEIGSLISELNSLLAQKESSFATLKTFEQQNEFINEHLSPNSSYAFSCLPNSIQRKLLMERDPHGNVQVSRIETEQLLIEMVSRHMNQLKATGQFNREFNALPHFMGYEGRCSFPSNFDANYCYALGRTAFILAANDLTGYITTITNLSSPANQWVPGGVPLTMLMNMEQRHGKQKPVIRKTLVDLNGKPFKYFSDHRDEWAIKTSYRFPGAIQYYGPDEICNQATLTLQMEQNVPPFK